MQHAKGTWREHCILITPGKKKKREKKLIVTKTNKEMKTRGAKLTWTREKRKPNIKIAYLK